MLSQTVEAMPTSARVALQKYKIRKAFFRHDFTVKKNGLSNQVVFL